jgi:RNase P subunit RPR2
MMGAQMSQPAKARRGSPCPNCHNPLTTPDALAKVMGRRAYPIIVTGCDVCNCAFKEENPVADCETQ